jgi:transcriptional regulator with XRE-family HTH domain
MVDAMTLSAEEIGRRLRAIREDAGQTQTALADALGVSQNTVSRWETGQVALTAVQLAGLCDYLGADPATIFDDNWTEVPE